MDASAPLVAATAVFVGVMALTVALSALRGGTTSGVRRRLDVHVVRVSADEAKRLERVNVLKAKVYSRFSWLNAALARFRPARTARIELLRANLQLTVAQYLVGRVVLAAGLAAAVWLIVGPTVLGLILLALAILGGIFVPRLVVKRRVSRRRKAFEAQLAEGIDLIVGALRSGYGFLQGLEAVSREVADPMRAEFTRLLEQVNVGANPIDALVEMTERIDSYDLTLFASSVSIHRTVGGNLAEVLENIAATVRERRRIRGEVFALTTGPRVSSYVLCLIPILMLVAFSLLNPGNYRGIMLGESIGHMMIAFAVIWSLIGLFFSSRVAKVEY